MEATKITYLNDDCLVAIFEYLELIDLLNVTDSSKQFYCSACRVYRRKFSNMNPILGQIAESDFGAGIHPIDVLEQQPRIFLTRPILFFKLLRNFGHMIRNLGVCFQKAKLCDEIESYLVEYCFESLQRFYYRSKYSRMHFRDVQKPFKNIKALTILMTSADKRDQYIFENNFPNLQDLRIFDMHRECFSENVYYKNIEYFTILMVPINDFPFLFGNLKHLAVSHSTITSRFCEFVSKIQYLETLKVINVWWERGTLGKMLDLQNIQSNVVEMSLQFKSRYESTEDIFRCMKQCLKLRKLSLYLPWIVFPIEARRHRSQAMQMIASKLGGNWICNTIDSCQNPFDHPIFEHMCIVLERITD